MATMGEMRTHTIEKPNGDTIDIVTGGGEEMAHVVLGLNLLCDRIEKLEDLVNKLQAALNEDDK